MVFGILGGDLRYKFLYEMLKKENYNVFSYRNKHIDKDVSFENLDDFLNKIDVLITPIPFTKDNKTVFNIDIETIEIDTLINKTIDFKINSFFGGLLPKELIEKLEENNIKTLDFLNDNSIAILNAIPTAEGAIQTAMEQSFKTIFNSKCLVLGYGRCGKILANMLKGIGANVDVSYRKDEDCSYIKAYGLNPINLYKVKNSIEKYDFIFNTIPSEILNKDLLENVNKDVIIIDLASAPGGIDYNYAREININAIYCPSLPGRVAPYSASQILKDKILQIIN